jgi:hypothetical protein
MGSNRISAELQACAAIGLIIITILFVPSFPDAKVYSRDYTELSLEELMDVTVFGPRDLTRRRLKRLPF